MNEEACRMCLQKGTRDNFINVQFGQPSIQSKLAFFAPEVNLDMVESPVVCGPCSAALDNAYQLRIRCIQTEEKLWAQINSTGKQIHFPIKLNDFLPPKQEEISPPIHNGYETSLFAPKTEVTEISANYNEDIELKPENLARPFTCSQCNKCFNLKTNLNIHMRTHTLDRPFICEYCQKSFTTKGNLITHVRTHTQEKPFKCKICTKAFIQKIQLSTHELLHVNIQAFQCDVCGKNLSTKGCLMTHKKIHIGVKSFVCPYCSKPFLSNGNLTTHIRTHTGEKPFVCNLCNRSFNQGGLLQAHKKKYHPNLDEVILVK